MPGFNSVWDAHGSQHLRGLFLELFLHLDEHVFGLFNVVAHDTLQQRGLHGHELLPHLRGERARLLGQLVLDINEGLDVLFQVGAHKTLHSIAVEANDIGQRRFREHRHATRLLFQNDLQQNTAGDVFLRLGIAHHHVCDVASELSYRHVVQETLAKLGGLDIVVNNAGTTHRNKPALQVTEDEFDRVYRVNLKSIYWSAQCVIPHFVSQGRGVMVNVASTTGVRPGPGLTWYSGSKAAMINLTKGLALEFAKTGVRINAVNPMIGETAMLGDFMGMEDTPANRERFLQRIPLGRFTRPQDVASAVTFLASDEASYLTGVCLDVDGGRNI
ncbi:MAG: SDR family oxidoreductase [Betaproteobacteria bacterium]|nr:SDR family oxidoreductase [Betaproteobacteria bacterium]